MTAFTDTTRNLALGAMIALAMVSKSTPVTAQQTETLTIAGGCFWCVESDFESVPGVLDTVVGYTGGRTVDPTYKQVTAGNTGHYEAAQVIYDPSVVSRKDLLELFLRSVDVTDADGQFCDRGSSYRTAIFTSDPQEKQLAENVKNAAQQELGQEIVTPVLDQSAFYKAEDYHQAYYQGDKVVLSRFGPIRQSKAYAKYRKACGRDARVQELWGDDAPFIHHGS